MRATPTPARIRSQIATLHGVREHGVRWEARLLKDAFYSDHAAARDRIVPVLLPGLTSDQQPNAIAEFSGRAVLL
jgi:hypothetical protein